MDQNEPKNFLEKLRGYDDGKKHRLLIGGTIVLALVVVYVWLGYFNNIVASTTESIDSAADTGQTPNFWQQLAQGSANFYAGALHELGQIGSVVKGPKQYEITPN